MAYLSDLLVCQKICLYTYRPLWIKTCYGYCCHNIFWYV